MRLRRFNEGGISSFDEFRASSSKDPKHLLNLLEDPKLTILFDIDVDVEVVELPNRLSAGKYIYDLFQESSITGLDNDQGFWSWLAAFYFEQLCPPNGKLGERARWVPSSNYQKYYRHLLAGPYKIYRAHSKNPECALAILANPPHTPGEISEQLASRQELVTNRSVMEVASRLYIGSDNMPKPGSGGRGPGSPRRFALMLNQLDLTWDLYGMTPEKMLELLPDEFDRFRT